MEVVNGKNSSFLFQKHRQDKKEDTCWQTALNVIVGRPLATSCEILIASTQFSVALATRKAQFRTLLSVLQLCFVN